MSNHLKKKLSYYTWLLSFLSIIDEKEKEEILQKIQGRSPHF
ncbi:hypothetical protein [Pseudalkalibacillus berkeleyi]|nr:hypothetical protein [Pseudalkalibacillus berkeleyi]